VIPYPQAPTDYPFPEITEDYDDLIFLSEDLSPAMLLDAYARGIFPMQIYETNITGWFSPNPRGVLPLANLKVSRSLRQSMNKYEIRLNTAFADVIKACADPSRGVSWITDKVIDAWVLMHRLGWAHSVEAWRDDKLVGGLYGLSLGGLFVGESMFHIERDASKVALVGLVEFLNDEYADRRLIDVQWKTKHLSTLGVIEMPRDEYLKLIPHTMSLPHPDFPWDSRFTVKINRD
jgi:leucyl/phenylalanyl-tRNA--protein transferase